MNNVKKQLIDSGICRRGTANLLICNICDDTINDNRIRRHIGYHITTGEVKIEKRIEE